MVRRIRTLHALSIVLCFGQGLCKGGGKEAKGGNGNQVPGDLGTYAKPQETRQQKPQRYSQKAADKASRYAAKSSDSQDPKPLTGGGGEDPSNRHNSASNPNEPNLVWHDEFVGNGLPDSAYWTISPGSDVYTAGHFLSMQASSDSQQVTASHMTTDQKVTFTYGTLEARIKVPDMTTYGLWATFWTIGESLQTGWPEVGEVTVMEMGYNETMPEDYRNHRVRSSVHFDNSTGQYNTYSKTKTGAIDLSEDFHVYRLEWTPEYMATFVDGEWIWQIDINPDFCDSCSELHSPHHIHLNLAVGGRFGCLTNCGRFSRGEMMVDYVRLYDNGYTVGTINGVDAWTRSNGSPFASGNYNKGGKAKGASSNTDSDNRRSKVAADRIPAVDGTGRRRRLTSSSDRKRKGARQTRGVRGAAGESAS